MIELVGAERLASLVPRMPRRPVVGSVALAGALVYAGLVVAAGVPARPEEGSAAARDGVQALPAIDVVETPGIAAIDEATAQTIARDMLVDLRTELAGASRSRRGPAPRTAATGDWLASLWNGIRAAGHDHGGASTTSTGCELHLRRSDGQARAARRRAARGNADDVRVRRQRDHAALQRQRRRPFTRTLMLVLEGGTLPDRRVRGRRASRWGERRPSRRRQATSAARRSTTSRIPVGLDFRQGAFRFGMSFDTTAMMGGGLCWLDYDEDGWLDLFVVNSHADVDIAPSDANGGLPRSALYHNVGGRFENVSAALRRRPPAAR